MNTTIPLIAVSVALFGCAQWKGPASMEAFNVQELRQAERALEAALSSADPGAWVEHYTEDAVFVAPGAPAVQGRDGRWRVAHALLHAEPTPKQAGRGCLTLRSRRRPPAETSGASP